MEPISPETKKYFIGAIGLIVIVLIVIGFANGFSVSTFVDYVSRDHSASRNHLGRMSPVLGSPYRSMNRGHTEG